MKTVNIHEAKTHLSRILGEITEGETYIICKNGEPLAQLTEYVPPKRSKIHPVLSKISLEFDPTEPLGEDEWPQVD
jgi:antitoxin (DNA-binding transcriptional repressor) of toxin-antitoxin stability system